MRKQLCIGIILSLTMTWGCGDSGNGQTNGGAVDTATDTGVALADGIFGSGDTGAAADTTTPPKDTGSAQTDTAQADTAQPPQDTGASADTTVTDTVAGSCVGRCGEYDSNASCNCDAQCAAFDDCCDDYQQVCGGETDTITDTTPAPDTSTGDTGAGSDSVAGNDSCQGLCGKYTSGKPCQCDSGCTQYGDCCGDYTKLCTTPDCKADADCDDKLQCTTDKCEAGKCVNTPAANECAIEGACYKDGDTDVNTCLVCKPQESQESWTVALGKSCDDANSCTTGDMCEASGACVGVKTQGCCNKDADCDDGNPCTNDSCDVATGSCSTSQKAGCCSSGVCCDLAQNVAKAKQTPCSSNSVAVEYQCSGQQVQKREAYPGCDGTSVSVCSNDKGNWSWTGWQTVLTCANGQSCKPQGNNPPICEGGSNTGCKNATDCDDGNPCTKDSCNAGSCSQQAIAGCCIFASDCDDGNACTTDQCEGNSCKNTATPCTATSDCEVAACDPKTGACNVAVKPGFCKVGQQCAKEGESNPKQTCQLCKPGVSQTSWSVADKCKCSSGVCCDIGIGQIKPKASKCSDKVEKTQYQCSKDGKTVELRQAYRGCTGGSNTCSVSSANYAWTEWATAKTCKTGTTCEVVANDKPGTCVPVGGTTCKAGSSCCTAAGTWAAKGTKCASIKLATEYKCSSSLAGSDVKRREAFPGCTGQSSTCSSATTNYAWGDWVTDKDCKKPQKCLVKDKTKPGVCTSTAQCTAGTTCCTDSGTWAAAKTKCGSTAVKSTYSCSSAKPGGSILVTQSYGGCAGGGATCSYADANLFVAPAKTVKKCSSTEICSVPDPSKPGVCTPAANVLCTKKDLYETGTSTKNSYSLGSFKDTDAAKILNPKVHFKSETDKDYFTYKLSDSGSSTVTPKLHIEWSATQPVRLCGYYACAKGTSGKGCAKVACPTGFISSSSTTVSAVSGNGCCTKSAATSGKLSWQPALPNGGSDLSGQVYFNIRNDSASCHEASVKLEFGEVKKLQCKPGSTCCTKDGTFAASKTQCGSSPVKTQYYCSSTAPGGDVYKQQTWRGCTGKSATCSISSTYYTTSPGTLVSNCSTSQQCVVSSPSLPGVCKNLSDPLCDKTDKYESGTYYSTAFDLGTFDDTSSAKILSPKVHFKNAYDSDYFTYKINDKLNLTDPKVHVEWTGAAQTSVCAYYACDKGANGKDCAPVKCPTGTTSSSRLSVSNGQPNGCCKTATKGTLSFKPDAPGTTDETGRAYIRIFNAAPICQEVATKLIFGSKSSTQCTPNTTCCSSAGTYQSQTSKCGSLALETQYKCSSSASGAKVLVRKSYAGCTGGSTTCSTSQNNRHWSSWSTFKQCGATEVCSVTSLNTAGTCKPASNPLCTKADPYEVGKSTYSAYNLGTYNDNSPAKFLSPKVVLSKSDYDYLRYDINDVLNLTDPRVQVEFSAVDKVKVCAYYRCKQGPGGEDCAPVKCPSGTTSSTFFSVSSSTPNGCCMTATKGTLSYKPDAPGTTNESGTVFLRISNEGNVCQEVTTKLVFGSTQSTQCTPNTTCCDASGQYAAKATKCGNTVLKTEYKCSSTGQGGDVLVRKAYSGCTGQSKTCSVSSSNYAWTGWTTFKNCTISQVCSVTDPNVAGVCKTSGSSAPLCSAPDKYETGFSVGTAYKVGAYKDSSQAVVLDPDVHFKTPFDSDFIKYDIEDALNLNNPEVNVSWTASEPLKVCAWYRCKFGGFNEDCANIKCPTGTTPAQNSLVSFSTVNGCCRTGKTGTIKYKPDAPNNTDDSGTAWVQVSNEAKVCQYVNAKLSFGGSTKACGDGVCASGESTSCPEDCASCLGKCGAPYSSSAPCQCDALCKSQGDCCWDHNLYCSK